MRASLVTLLLASCANVSSFQTGRTLGKGELAYGLGAEIGIVEEFEAVTGADEDSARELDTGVPIPALAAWVRYGLADNIDAGLRLFTVGLAGELKAQFAGDAVSPFSAAAGLSVSYFGFDVPDEEEDSQPPITFGSQLAILDVTSALYLSYSLPDGWLTMYAAPKYISRSIVLGAEIEGTEDRALGLDLVGTGLGLNFGEDLSVYVEAGLFAPIGFDGLVLSLGVGVEI